MGTDSLYTLAALHAAVKGRDISDTIIVVANGRRKLISPKKAQEEFGEDFWSEVYAKHQEIETEEFEVFTNMFVDPHKYVDHNGVSYRELYLNAVNKLE